MSYNPDFSEWFSPSWEQGFAPGLGGGGGATWEDNFANDPSQNANFGDIWWDNMSSAWNTLGYDNYSALAAEFEDNMFTEFQDSQQWENFQESQTEQGEDLSYVFDAFSEQNQQEINRFAAKIARDKHLGEAKRASLEREASLNADIQSLTTNRIVNEAINSINQTYTREGMYGFTNQTGISTPLAQELANVSDKINSANANSSISRGDLRAKKEAVNKQYGFSFEGETYGSSDSGTGEFPWESHSGPWASSWMTYDSGDLGGGGQYGIFQNLGATEHGTGEQMGGSADYWFGEGWSAGGEPWESAGVYGQGSTLSIGEDAPWGVGSAVKSVLANFEHQYGNFVMGTDTVNSLLSSANSQMNRAYGYGRDLQSWQTQQNLDYANAYDSWLAEQYTIAGLAAGGSG